MQIESLKLTPVSSSVADYTGKDKAPEAKGFGEYFAEALENVNALQIQGQQANINLAAGKIEDISQVVIATEKAGIAMQLTTQIRNKAVEAYQEIMRMQV